MKLPFVAREALEAAEQKFSELNQEYQNFRRRNASVQEDSYAKGSSDVLKAMLPVYDNLKLALEQPCEDKAFRAGIEMTLKELASYIDYSVLKPLPSWMFMKLPRWMRPLIPPSMKRWSILRTRSWQRTPWSA